MLKLENINFHFGEKIIFEKLNLSFTEGQVHGIVGKNGIGKTTLFRNMAGIYRPQSGNLLFNDRPLKKDDISFLPTSPYFYPYINGGEYIKLVNGSISPKISQYADLLDLPLNQLIDTYSTGMKKKVAFLGAISQDRPVLILDEPFNGVDLESNEILKSIILKEKRGRVLLISSHILSSLTNISDSIYFIQKGFIVDIYAKNEFTKLEAIIQNDIEEKINRAGVL
ncbi:MAG: ATP-binding cassette domain-containing protein [Saprospiraceae bacterium]